VQLVEATRSLLWEAYKDPLNQRWVHWQREGSDWLVDGWLVEGAEVCYITLAALICKQSAAFSFIVGFCC
jgi:hypothetical protein